MEGEPGQQLNEAGAAALAGAEFCDLPEAQRIREGIAEALRDGSVIDDETAWLIAKIITPGSGALHQLALTGEVSPDIGEDLEVAYEVLPALADSWIAALDGYCFRRRDKEPVAGWPECPR